METTLQEKFLSMAELIHEASHKMFHDNGSVPEAFFMMMKNGDAGQLAIPHDKLNDRVLVVRLLRGLVRTQPIHGIIHVSEVWTKRFDAEDPDAQPILDGTVRLEHMHPEDREEAVFCSAHTEEGTVKYWTDIIRRDGAMVTLEPRESLEGDMEGRFSNFWK